MRQFTSIEFEAYRQARLEYENNTLFSKPDNRAGFSAGFSKALDFTDPQLAALTAERDAQQSLINLVMSRVALLEGQRDTLLAFVNGKLTRAEMEESLSKFEGVTLR